MPTQLGQIPFSPRGLLSRTEEQSRTRSGHSGGVVDQPQYRRLWRHRTPCARSFSRSPSPRHPPLTQNAFSPRSLVRGGQTSPHKPRLVASHSTCPPLSSSPHAHSFVLGTAVINMISSSLHPLLHELVQRGGVMKPMVANGNSAGAPPSK
jgi:hypothetical protein